jgi:hypothetical protein
VNTIPRDREHVVRSGGLPFTMAWNGVHEAVDGVLIGWS